MEVANLFNSEIYKARRDVLRRNIGSGQILLLGNTDAPINFKDNYYPFRQDSTFLYYFGVALPDLVGIINCDDPDLDYLIGDDISLEHIIWMGQQPKMEFWAERVGVMRTELMAKLTNLLNDTIQFLPPYRGSHYLFYQRILGLNPSEVDQAVSIPLIKAVVQQRNIKSSEEIIELNRAVDISSKMQLEVIKSARPNMKEHELVGIAAKVARDHNVDFSFLPIMTIHGQVLHNHNYGHTIRHGDMVLFDGGTESSKYYAGDMTRTFPVSARFDKRQREIYQIVYSAHMHAISLLRPGRPYKDIHLAASIKLVEGLIDIGLMKGDPAEAVKEGAHTLFFQCGLGHMMGLDVHDMENLGEQYVGYSDDLRKSTSFGLKSLRLGKALESGNVLTVEPGIYIIPELIDMYKSSNKYENFVDYQRLESYRDFGGVRIEDDFVITDEGADLLGTPLARTVEEIESLRV